jgi:YidC/Oxa1 family membrane protein insertase
LNFLQAAVFINSAQVQSDPGFIVGPISTVFGYIIDFFFNIAYALTHNNSLGISIILLTIAVRCLMLPLGVKQQKSMIAMQKLNPEIQKIRNKYSGNKDPELQKKMNAEMQALYAKHKVNPLSGCLPLLVTMPLFVALSYIMNQSYLFVRQLGAVYDRMSGAIHQIPAYTNHMADLALPYIPRNMLEQGFDISMAPNMNKLLSRLSATDWNTLFSRFETLPGGAQASVATLREAFEQKTVIETFFSLPLTEASGWAWPGIIIPILAVVTTLASSYIGTRISQSHDPNSAKQQRMMMVIMPLMMGFMTINMPAGVGVYWITSSVFQVGQSYVLNKRSGIPLFKDGVPLIGQLIKKKEE